MTDKMTVGVLASGRGTNLQALLDATHDRSYPARVVTVLSDRQEARALQRAEKEGVYATYIAGTGQKWEEQAVAKLKEHEVKLVCLAGFMHILSPFFLQSFPAVMNIHPSLLPAFPGLEAQKQALDYGVKISGCTVHFVDEGVDTGPIILQKAVPVEEDDTPDKLADRILAEEHKIYPRAVELYARGLLVRQGRQVKVLEGG